MSDATLILRAPIAGWCEDLSAVPDPVFSERILGDGICIDPTASCVVAPFDGTVTSLPGSAHAVGVRHANGTEVLIHIGVDTVALNGTGFTPRVVEGQRVLSGETLIEFDMLAIAPQVPSLRTPVLVIGDAAGRIEWRHAGGMVNTNDDVLHVNPTPEPSARAAIGDAAGEQSRTIVVGLEHGIHARPAGVLAAAIATVDARVEIRTLEGKAADARSPVSLMALGVTCGDTVTVIAAGRDAAAAMRTALERLDARDPQSTHAPLAPGETTPVEPGAALSGQSAVAGIAVGTAFPLREWAPVFPDAVKPAADEQKRLDDALDTVRNYLDALAGASSGAGREIAQAHRTLLDDPALLADSREKLLGGASAERAWHDTVTAVAASLSRLSDARLRERAADLGDLGQRVLRVLAGEAPGDKQAIPDSAVVIARDLLPSQLLELDTARLAGIALTEGGATSHVAILAAALNVPTMVATAVAALRIEAGVRVILDADAGELHVSPPQDLIATTRARIAQASEQRQRAAVRAGEPCISADGKVVEVFANIASIADARSAVEQGADGYGLLRSEFLFMNRATPPSVEEQRSVYQSIADTFGKRPLTVRLLDAGADKPIAYLPQATEENPALGVRGIRLSLAHPELLDAQLRALLSVSSAGPLRIMVPMVSSMEEIEAVAARLRQVSEELSSTANVELGVMIETPAAALLVPELASVVDFFSIGTNDLTQYTLAMDRLSPQLASRLDVLHPAVLRSISAVCRDASVSDKPVAVCGSAAGDPLAAPVLLGLGVSELSAVAALIPVQKERIRDWSLERCEALATAALRLDRAERVRALVREAIEKGTLA